MTTVDRNCVAVVRMVAYRVRNLGEICSFLLSLFYHNHNSLPVQAA